MTATLANDKKTHHPNTENRLKFILEEARMVLPGIQALLGFQLVAVFNQSFSDKLSTLDQYIHLIAILSSLCAIALLLTPAALHRQSEPDGASPDFVRTAGRLVALGMVPLMLSFCLDWYVVSNVVTQNIVVSTLSTMVVFVSFMTFWVIWPQLRKRKNRVTVDIV